MKEFDAVGHLNVLALYSYKRRCAYMSFKLFETNNYQKAVDDWRQMASKRFHWPITVEEDDAIYTRLELR